MPDPVTFGQWLRQRRKSYDFSQETLADRVGCVFETIRKIEAGRRKPSRQLAALLAKHLGVPAEQLDDFVAFARQGVSDFGSANGSGQQYQAATRFNNLPVERTSLVGRDEVVKSVSALFAQPSTRIITLTGPPGIGKTRLAMRVADVVAHLFGDGVAFVPLSGVSESSAVGIAINQTLGLQEADNRTALATLKSWLAEKEMLLLLDNFEQVMSARALVSDLLDACPDLKVLVTSRSTLRLYGEQQFTVPPLPFPDSSTAPDTIADSPAVELFTQRAHAANPAFILTNLNAPSVASICRKLDGMPLAIELAAAQIKSLSPEGILARLDKQLELLVEGAYDLPPRQRTLRGAIAWSYDLLDESERKLFRRLSVFAGGCDERAIEAVCTDECTSLHPGKPVLAAINSLIDRSLLRSWNEPDGEPRYRTLDVVREFARETLDQSGETDLMQQRHAAYFLDLAEQAEPELTSGRRERALKQLDAELDNLRAALQYALTEPTDSKRIEIGLRISGSLLWFWYFRSAIGEGRKWLERTLNLAGSLRSTPAGAKALNAAGRLALLQDDYSTMQAHLLESANAWREIGDKTGLAYALSNLGLATVYRTRSRAGEGYAFIEQAVALFRSEGESWGLAFALDALSDATLLSGGSEAEAACYREESLALFKELGDEWGVASQLTELGHACLRQGEYERARHRLEQALRIQRSTGDRWVIGHTVRSLGDVAWYQHDLERARAFYAESLLQSRDLGDRLRESFALRNIGRIALELGDREEAASLYRQSLTIAYELGSEQNIALCLTALAEILMLDGDPLYATRILGKADSMREASRGVIPPTDQVRYAQMLDNLHNTLPGGRFTAAYEEGKTMSMGAAIAEVGEDAG